MPSTSALAMPKSAVKAPICEVTISPLVLIMVIITKSSQKIGVRSICRGVKSRLPATKRGEAVARGPRPAATGGRRKPCATRKPVSPKSAPNCSIVVECPAARMAVGDGKREQQGPHAVAGGDEPGRQAAAIGKPLHHVADDPDVDDARPDAAEQAVAEIERPHARRLRRQHPAQARDERADRQQHARSEALDERALGRRQEGLHDDQHRERHLELRQVGIERARERPGEQRPHVLRAGDASPWPQRRAPAASSGWRPLAARRRRQRGARAPTGAVADESRSSAGCRSMQEGSRGSTGTGASRCRSCGPCS